MATISLNDLNMHDSEILAIRVLLADGLSRIELDLDYIESYQPFVTSKRMLRFDNCYKLLADLNMSIIPGGNILEAWTLQNTTFIADLQNHWPGDLNTKALRHHRIVPNTSAGSIDIISTELDFL